MRSSIILAVRLSVFTVLTALSAHAGGTLCSGQTNEKFRVLVDKVMTSPSSPIPTTTHMQEVSAAGFNVFVPRWGGDNAGFVTASAQQCDLNGLCYMAWIRGSGNTTEDARKMVWQDGTVQSAPLEPE